MQRKNHKQPNYDFINNSAWKSATYVRRKINEWFENYEVNLDFEKRFKSKNNQEHNGAFFELFCNELFYKAGYSVKIHQKANKESTKLPDFEITLNNEIAFYTECTLSNTPNRDLAIDDLQDEILDIVEGIYTPNHFINIDFNKTEKTSISKKKFRNYLQGKINELSGSINLIERGLNKWKFMDNGWEIIISAIPKSQKLKQNNVQRALGVTTYGPAIQIDSTQPLLNALKSKRASKYGKLSVPFLIAINTLDFYIEDIDIIKTLFGSTYYSDNGFMLSKYNYENSSFFINKSNIQNRSVSAILLAKDLSPWNMNSCKMEVWHNPFAKNPLDEKLLKLPQVQFDFINNKYIINKIEGKNASEIMEIDGDYNFSDY